MTVSRGYIIIYTFVVCCAAVDNSTTVGDNSTSTPAAVGDNSTSTRSSTSTVIFPGDHDTIVGYIM